MSLSSARQINLQSSGTFSQTGPGYSEVQPRDVLHSKFSDYELQRFRFTGCFSTVAVCKDIDTKDVVAVKIFKKRAIRSLEPNRELAMLKRIRGLDPENIVRFFEDFEHKGHTCLAFEMLDKNLHELLREKPSNRLSLREIRPIAQQLIAALESLKTAGVIHTNIKPHNIMLTRQKPVRVKVIDFGSAIAAAEVKRGVIMQPVAYRSLDVILGLPLSEAVDMWSLGGVLATMYLGSLPFPQRCQYYQVKAMVETLGQPEDKLLSDGAHTQLYFSPNEDSTTPAWRLKMAEEYKAATGFPPQKHRGSSTQFNCLNDLVMLNLEESFGCKMRFVSLLLGMLRLNPQERLTPSEALRQPFITLIEPGAEEVVTSATAESSSSDVEDITAVCSNNTSVGAAVSAVAYSDDAPRVNDISAGYEASESTAGYANDTASAHETLSGPVRVESIDSGPMEDVSAPVGRDSDAGASYDQAPDATAGSADDDEAAVPPASTEASTAPVRTDLYDAVSADKGTSMTELDESAVYRNSDSTDAHVAPDGVLAIGSRNRRVKRIRRFFSRSCCCSTNVEQ